MSIWILIASAVGLVHLAALLVLIGCALWAPEGYEDTDGFRLGRQPERQPVPSGRMALNVGLKEVA